MHGTPWRVRPTSGPRLPLRRHRDITGLIGAGIPAPLAVEGEDVADTAVRTGDDVLASTPTAPAAPTALRMSCGWTSPSWLGRPVGQEGSPSAIRASRPTSRVTVAQHAPAAHRSAGRDGTRR